MASKRRPLVVEVNTFDQWRLAELTRWKRLDRAIDVAKKLRSLNKPYAFRVRNIDTGEIAWSSETEASEASKPPQVGQVYERDGKRREVAAVDPCGMHWFVSWKRPGGNPMRFSTWCSTWNEWASKAKLVEAKDGTAKPASTGEFSGGADD